MEKRENIEIPSTPFAFIWFCIKPYKKWYLWGTFLYFLFNIFISLQAYTYKGFVDAANSYGIQHAGSVNSVFWWVLAYPALILLAAIASRGSGFLFNWWTVYARTEAIDSLFKYLSLHSLSYFNDRFSGALSNRVSVVSDNVSRLAAQVSWNSFGLLVPFFVTTTVLLNVSKSLTLTFVLGFLILIPLNIWMTRLQKYLSERRVELGTKLRGEVVDVITNISGVQQYAHRSYEINRLNKTINNYRDADVKSDNFGERIFAINNFLIVIFISAIIIWSFFLWSKGSMSIGTLVMIVSLVGGFMTTLSNIGQNINAAMKSYGEMKEGLRDIIIPHDIVDKPNARKLSVEKSEVVFENVTYAYSKDPRKIFENLSFKVKGGQKVGIVGTSGAGKTTLMKLLLRQHDLTDGSIRIDDQDISEVTQESLREHVSIVPQEPMLFHRTIRENIMYGKLDAREEEMIEVAKKAQAHDFIEQLPQKYDSLVGERGVKLSVGQRQRIAIARAFLKNAPILILDEATSALDSESEVAVQKALQALMEGKTVFAIAHRLSTLREMDRILVFKDGNIVEDGTHRTLLKNKEGVYASFWAHQAGGFIKED